VGAAHALRFVTAWVLSRFVTWIGYTPKVYPQPSPPSETLTVSFTGLVLSRLFKAAKAAQKSQGLSWARTTNGE
jgi:hypothetical protein